jgi:hypothetical protein
MLTAATVALLVSRRPDAFRHPQFWAEDGSTYFRQAYNDPRLAVVFEPVAGYLAVLPRFTAWVGARMPLSTVPLFFTVVAGTLEMLPVLFLASRRMAHVAPRWLRLAMGLLYLASPNWEVHANLANAQWHLALLAGLVLVAVPPRNRAGQYFDTAVLLLCGLTGPFAFVMLPIAVARFIIDRDRESLRILVVVAATFIVQLPVLLHSGRLGVVAHPERWSGPGKSVPLGAAPAKLIYMLTDRVFIPALTGTEGNAHFNLYLDHRIVLAALCCIAGVTLVIVAMCTAAVSVRLFAAYCALALAAALASPIGSTTVSQWDFLLVEPFGGRYFLLPVGGFIGLVTWGVSRIPLAAARWATGGLLLSAFLAGSMASWSYRPRTNYNLVDYERTLAHAPPGSSVVVPINPDGWEMTLTKR